MPLITLRRVGASAFAALLFATGPAFAADFLDPAEAFRATADAAYARDRGALSFRIESGYYLYRDRTSVRAQEGAALAGALQLPPGQPKFDPNFGSTMDIWKHELRLELPVPERQAAGGYELQVQGCAEQGLCYPPQRLHIRQSRDAQGRVRLELTAAPVPAAAQALPSAQSTAAASVMPAVTPAVTPAATPATVDAAATAAATVAVQDADPQDLGVVLQALRSGRWLAIAGLFLLLGLGLAFTPCVLPMMPILSSIIVGQSQPVSRWRGLGLAAAYALGMALVYTALGVAAGLAGAGLAAALQNPWVLGAFGLLLAALALSMFGVWEFQMPGFIQSRAQQAANALPGGRYLGVFAMGGLSALMVGPCVAAPLAGALVYIGQSRDALLGALALFSLAMGMSVPLLLLGVSAGTLLPRAGAWMDRVKMAFGVLLLAVALWLVTPVLPGPALPGLLGVMLLLGAAQLWGASAWRRGFSLLLGLWACSLLLGAWSGGRSIALPLQHLARAGAPAAGGAGAAGAASAAGPEFRRVADVAALDAALAQARREARPVLLDFYADWCVACKEMEHETFRHARMQPLLQRVVLLQADVTANHAADQALLRRFGLFGPPGVLLFNAQGQEQVALRSIGFVGAEDFARRLQALGL